MHYILSLLLFLNILNASQNDFSVIIDETFDNSLVDITQDFDRTISAIGITKSSTNSNQSTDRSFSNPFDYLSNISSSHGFKIRLVKLDDKADVILKKSISLSKFSKAVAIVKTPQDGFFVGGHTQDGSLIVLKLSKNGRTITSKEFGTKNNDKMNSLIALKDGGVLAVATSMSTRSQKDPLYETGLGLNDIYLTRFSKDGNKIWSKKYGTEYDDKAIGAVEADDGSILVLSQTYHETKKDMTLMRINENGNKIWSTQHKNDKSATPYKIIKLRDGNFLVSLTQLDDMHKEQVRLIKFDLQNNILLDKEIYTTYASALKDIKEYSNSNIIGVGYARDSYNTDGLVMLLDRHFGLLQQEHFGKDNYDEFNAVKILHNSQAAIVGLNTNEKSQESNMWVVKLNKDLSMAQTSTKSDDVYNELNTLFKNEVDSKYLEIKKDLSINLINKDLYFEAGKYGLSQKQKEFLKGFSIKLFSYLQKNQNLVDTFEINGHTSSEWRSVDFTSGYLNNEKLSTKRSYSALEYMFRSQNVQMQKYLSKILKSSGLSYSKRVFFNEYEDKKRSRRINFKILLNQQQS